VATAVGEHPDWVQPGETGYLVPPGDPQALAAALITVLRDRAAAEQMGRRALEYGRTRFAWPEIAARTAATYTRVIAARQGTR